MEPKKLFHGRAAPTKSHQQFWFRETTAAFGYYSITHRLEPRHSLRAADNNMRRFCILKPFLRRFVSATTLRPMTKRELQSIYLQAKSIKMAVLVMFPTPRRQHPTTPVQKAIKSKKNEMMNRAIMARPISRRTKKKRKWTNYHFCFSPLL